MTSWTFCTSLIMENIHPSDIHPTLPSTCIYVSFAGSNFEMITHITEYTVYRISCIYSLLSKFRSMPGPLTHPVCCSICRFLNQDSKSLLLGYSVKLYPSVQGFFISHLYIYIIHVNRKVAFCPKFF